jgi:hypothetical protein
MKAVGPCPNVRIPVEEKQRKENGMYPKENGAMTFLGREERIKPVVVEPAASNLLSSP